MNIYILGSGIYDTSLHLLAFEDVRHAIPRERGWYPDDMVDQLRYRLQ